MSAVCNYFHLNTPHCFKGTSLVTADCVTEAILWLQDTYSAVQRSAHTTRVSIKAHSGSVDSTLNVYVSE